MEISISYHGSVYKKKKISFEKCFKGNIFLLKLNSITV